MSLSIYRIFRVALSNVITSYHTLDPFPRNPDIPIAPRVADTTQLRAVAVIQARLSADGFRARDLAKVGSVKFADCPGLELSVSHKRTFKQSVVPGPNES